MRAGVAVRRARCAHNVFLTQIVKVGFRIGIMRAALRALPTIVDGAEGYAG
jgi:hypothetical protein